MELCETYGCYRIRTDSYQYSGGMGICKVSIYTYDLPRLYDFDDDTVSSQNDIGIFAFTEDGPSCSFWGIVLPAIFSAYPVFIMFQFFVSIPEEVLDAARIDGANEWQLFVRIGVPLGKTGIISSMMLSVLECWNMIEQPMVFLDTKSRWPVALYVPQITENGIGVSFAVSILVLILPFLVFLAGQEYIQKGIAAFMKGE